MKTTATVGIKADLVALAGAVNAVAKSMLSAGWSAPGCWGDSKVFIGAIAARLEVSDLDVFKAMLIEANRLQLVNLSRADLVEEMDPALLASSVIDDGRGWSAHFVRV